MNSVELVAFRPFLLGTVNVSRGDIIQVPIEQAKKLVANDRARYTTDPDWQFEILEYADPIPAEYWTEEELDAMRGTITREDLIAIRDMFLPIDPDRDTLFAELVKDIEAKIEACPVA